MMKQGISTLVLHAPFQGVTHEVSNGGPNAVASNKSLNKRNRSPKDEFYTQLSDIESELRHYAEQLRGKVIFCNCDDPYESNFFKYFALNFRHLGLKKLITTSFAGSPIAGTQLPGLEDPGARTKAKLVYKVEITDVPDANGDNAIDITDVEFLLKNDKNVLTPLSGDGDFRSPECVALLDEADVVVTNPPFSLFREFVTTLIDKKKDFLIIGSKNHVTYAEIFQLFMDNVIWLGHGFRNGNAYFEVPDSYKDSFVDGVYDPETGLVKFRNVGWFTNLDTPKRHEEITLFKKYSPEEYPEYTNYPAIEVSRIANIPMDYDGLMGVPITFLDRYNPKQFRIIGNSQGLAEPMEKFAEKGTYRPGNKRFYLKNAEGKHDRLYDRIIIQRIGE
jgi:hypothetical protein